MSRALVDSYQPSPGRSPFIIPGRDGTIFAHSDTSGITRLPYTVQQLLSESPYRLEEPGGSVFLWAESKTLLFGVDAGTGEVRVTMDIASTVCPEQPAAAARPLLWLGRRQYYVRAVAADPSGEVLWNFTVSEVVAPSYHVGGGAGAGGGLPASAGAGERELTASQDGILVSLDRASSSAWRVNVSAPVATIHRVSDAARPAKLLFRDVVTGGHLPRGGGGGGGGGGASSSDMEPANRATVFVGTLRGGQAYAVPYAEDLTTASAYLFDEPGEFDTPLALIAPYEHKLERGVTSPEYAAAAASGTVDAAGPMCATNDPRFPFCLQVRCGAALLCLLCLCGVLVAMVAPPELCACARRGSTTCPSPRVAPC
jgi:hypothetical protein